MQGMVVYRAGVWHMQGIENLSIMWFLDPGMWLYTSLCRYSSYTAKELSITRSSSWCYTIHLYQSLTTVYWCLEYSKHQNCWRSKPDMDWIKADRLQTSQSCLINVVLPPQTWLPQTCIQDVSLKVNRPKDYPKGSRANSHRYSM